MEKRKLVIQELPKEKAGFKVGDYVQATESYVSQFKGTVQKVDTLDAGMEYLIDTEDSGPLWVDGSCIKLATKDGGDTKEPVYQVGDTVRTKDIPGAIKYEGIITKIFTKDGEEPSYTVGSGEDYMLIAEHMLVPTAKEARPSDSLDAVAMTVSKIVSDAVKNLPSIEDTVSGIKRMFDPAKPGADKTVDHNITEEIIQDLVYSGWIESRGF